MTIQTLERAIGVLRILSTASSEGWRLVDLQRETGLTKPTVHRILDSLKGEDFVEQLEHTRRYRLGKELALLGWMVGRTAYDLRDLASKDMAAVAEKTADTSFLTIRSGQETVCIDRQSGSYPVKAFTVDVGTRRPLGVGATGVALLAGFEPEHVEAVLKAGAGQLARFPNASPRQIRQAVADARREGYAFSDELVVKGVRGVAVAIRDTQGRTIAAIGTAAINDRMTSKRIPEIVRTLRMHAIKIEQRVAFAENHARFGTRRVVKASRRPKTAG